MHERQTSVERETINKVSRVHQLLSTDRQLDLIPMPINTSYYDYGLQIMY